MEKANKVCAENFDEMASHLEEVYENAYSALQFGGTKESLLAAIEYALEMYEDVKSMPGACQKCGQQVRF